MRTHRLNRHSALRACARALVPGFDLVLSPGASLPGTTAEVRTALADHLGRGGALESPGVFGRMTSE